MTHRRATDTPRELKEISGRTPTYGWESGPRARALEFAVEAAGSTVKLVFWQTCSITRKNQTFRYMLPR